MSSQLAAARAQTDFDGSAAAPSPRTRREPRPRYIPPGLLGLLLPSTLLIGAEVGARAGWIPSNLLPAPTQILETMADLGARGLLGHIGASTLRVAAGFGVGAAL